MDLCADDDDDINNGATVGVDVELHNDCEFFEGDNNPNRNTNTNTSSSSSGNHVQKASPSGSLWSTAPLALSSASTIQTQSTAAAPAVAAAADSHPPDRASVKRVFSKESSRPRRASVASSTLLSSKDDGDSQTANLNRTRTAANDRYTGMASPLHDKKDNQNSNTIVIDLENDADDVVVINEPVSSHQRKTSDASTTTSSSSGGGVGFLWSSDASASSSGSSDTRRRPTNDNSQPDKHNNQGSRDGSSNSSKSNEKKIHPMDTTEYALSMEVDGSSQNHTSSAQDNQQNATTTAAYTSKEEVMFPYSTTVDSIDPKKERRKRNRENEQETGREALALVGQILDEGTTGATFLGHSETIEASHRRYDDVEVMPCFNKAMNTGWHINKIASPERSGRFFPMLANAQSFCLVLLSMANPHFVLVPIPKRRRQTFSKAVPILAGASIRGFCANSAMSQSAPKTNDPGEPATASHQKDMAEPPIPRRKNTGTFSLAIQSCKVACGSSNRRLCFC